MKGTITVVLCLIAICTTAARLFVTASAQYGEQPQTAVSNYPFSISAWVYPTETNVAHVIASVSSGTTSRAQISISSAASPQAAAVTSGGTTGTASGTPSPEVALNTWQHVCGVFISSTNREIYWNGVLLATNSTAAALTGIDRVTVAGRYNAGAVGAFFSGSIAEVTVYNVALTSSEVARLAAKAPPKEIRGSNALRFYNRVAGEFDPEPSVTGGSITFSNSPTRSEHPLVY